LFVWTFRILPLHHSLRQYMVRVDIPWDPGGFMAWCWGEWLKLSMEKSEESMQARRRSDLSRVKRACRLGGGVISEEESCQHLPGENVSTYSFRQHYWNWSYGIVHCMIHRIRYIGSLRYVRLHGFQYLLYMIPCFCEPISSTIYDLCKGVFLVIFRS